MKKFYFILSVAVIALSLTVSCGNGRADVPEGSVEVSVGGNDIMMVRIEPGKFVMGGTSEQTECDYYSEKPEHSVVITKPFYISQTEVTQELWEHVMGTNPSMYKAHDDTEKDLPVLNVSWYDCKEFINKLNDITGRKFRLPTEAEWEFAARGAGKGYSLPYAGSKFVDRVACMATNSEGRPHPVAQYGPNEIGIYDMSGNVWEWVEDNFQQYKPGELTDPLVHVNDTLSHSVRGGSFTDRQNKCRTSSRDGNWPDYKQTNLGFRLAMDE